MLNKIRKLIKGKTLRDLLIVQTENFISKGLNFLLIIITARVLGPSDYGLFSLVVVLILFLVPLLDFGMENAVVYFSCRKPERKLFIFGLYAIAKIVISLFLLLIFLIFHSFFARIFHLPLNEYVLIIFLGFTLESLILVITTTLQAEERFLERAIVTCLSFVFKLFLIGFLIFSGERGVFELTLSFSLSSLPLLLFYAPSIREYLIKFFNYKFDSKFVKEILNYQKWLFIGSVSVNILTRVDFFFVTFFLSMREVGLYNSAFQLLAPFSMIPYVFGKVMLPKVSKYENRSQMLEFVRKSNVFCGGVTIFVILCFIFSKGIILSTFGNKYIGSIPILKILLLGFVFSLWAGMYNLIFYSIGKPKFIVISSYIQLVVYVIFALNFIPIFGVNGAALGRIFSSLAFLLVTIYFVRSVFLKLKNYENY